MKYYSIVVTKVNSYFKCFGENRLADELNGLRYHRGEALSEAMIKPPKNVLELRLLERSEMAMQGAMEKVLEEHVRERLP